MTATFLDHRNPPVFLRQLSTSPDGVALGNWLLLERWMDEQWFVDTCGNSSLDEWSCMESLGDRKNDVLTEHWNRWITDEDITFIAES